MIACVVNDDRLLTQKTNIGRVQVIDLTSVRPSLKGFHKPLAIDLDCSLHPQLIGGIVATATDFADNGGAM